MGNQGLISPGADLIWCFDDLSTYSTMIWMVDRSINSSQTNSVTFTTRFREFPRRFSHFSVIAGLLLSNCLRVQSFILYWWIYCRLNASGVDGLCCTHFELEAAVSQGIAPWNGKNQEALGSDQQLFCQGKEISELREKVEECKSDNRVITQRHDQEVEKNAWNVEKIQDLQVGKFN